MSHLRDPQTRAIGDTERGLVFGPRCGLLDAEHIRQLAIVAGNDQAPG